MSAGWVAGSVRAREIAGRRLGAEATRHLAAGGSLDQALRGLAGTPYARGAMPGQGLASAQHGVAETVLWYLRILAGWLPQGGRQLVRVLAGWFEIANVDEMLQRMAGRPADASFELGALETAWPRLERSASLAALRAALAASAWNDPGGASELAIRIGMRVRWAQRVAAFGDPAPVWAARAVALLVAGERFGAGRRLEPAIAGVAATLLGKGAANAATLEELKSQLPARLACVFEQVRGPRDLWLAEAAWWARLERDGSMLLAKSVLGYPTVLGAVAVLASDARRITAALEIAARGGPVEAYDAVA
jgi:hypothetical protein